MSRDPLFNSARRDEIRHLVTQWISVPSLPDSAIPASPDDVFYLLDAIEAMRKLLVEADSAISHLHYRKSWPLDTYETDRLIGRLRSAS